MTEDGRKHLEFIQQVVTRMNSNSFQLKGWSVALVAGLFALAVAEANKVFAGLAIFPIVIFWLLDAYYLGMERWFRELYDHLRVMTDAELIGLGARSYCMKPGEFNLQRECLLEVARRWTIAGFHLPLLLACIAVLLFGDWLAVKSASAAEAKRKVDAVRLTVLATIEDDRKRAEDAVRATVEAKRNLDAAQTAALAAIALLETNARSRITTLNALADQLSHVGDLQLRLVQVEAQAARVDDLEKRMQKFEGTTRGRPTGP
jgi:hypothetical protein